MFGRGFSFEILFSGMDEVYMVGVLGVDIFYGTVGALNYVVKSDGEWNVNINIFWTERLVGGWNGCMCTGGFGKV